MSLKVRDVIEAVRTMAGVTASVDTVDTIKTGDPLSEVSGIVTTFTATPGVIRKAGELGASLIITHEPTFYDHRDKIHWQKGLEVYEAKLRLLLESGISVWRFHDGAHLACPDLIVRGMVRELGWEAYVREGYYEAAQQYLKIPKITIPALKLSDLARGMKSKLHAEAVRFIGDPDLSCGSICFFVGAPSADWQIELLDLPFDVLVLGETCEWSVCEYMRDAHELGIKKGCIVLGHRNSEEFGMKYLAERIRPLFPQVPVSFVPAGDPFGSI